MDFFWDEISSFEDIDYENITNIAKVPGGWIVRPQRWCKNKDMECCSESMIFIPDSDHVWKIDC